MKKTIFNKRTRYDPELDDDVEDVIGMPGRTSYEWFVTTEGKDAFLADLFPRLHARQEMMSSKGPTNPEETEWRIMVDMRDKDVARFEADLYAHEKKHGTKGKKQ